MHRHPHEKRPGLAAGEFVLVVLVFAADVAGWVPLSKTPFLLALGWVSLRVRGMGWRDVGWRRPRSWAAALGLGAVAGAGMSLLELSVTHPVLSRLMGEPPDLSDFEALEGDLAVFLAALALVWVLAAFGEELVYRGHLMSRVAELGGGSTNAWVVSLISVSVLFGVGHVDQGPTGMLENVSNGILLGLLYLAAGRNLAMPIVAHGVQDTVDLTLIYLGQYPGM